MNPWCFRTVLTASWIVTVSALAEGEPVSLKGHWHADFGQSSDPYGPHPKNVRLEIVVDDGRTYESIETTIGVGGKTTTESVRAPVNGKSYPVQGSRYGISIALTDWAPGSIRIELSTPNGLRGVEVCRVAADLNVMTCDETDTSLKGVATSAKSVYVRD